MGSNPRVIAGVSLLPNILSKVQLDVKSKLDSPPAAAAPSEDPLQSTSISAASNVLCYDHPGRHKGTVYKAFFGRLAGGKS